MSSCNQKSCRYHVHFKISLALLQLLMNNQEQFVCLWRCVLPDFVVQRNNFSRLVFSSSVIHKTIGKKLISKTNINQTILRGYNMPFFYLDNIQFFGGKLSIFSKIWKLRKQLWAGVQLLQVNSSTSVCARYCTKQVPYPFPQRQLICERYMKGYFALSRLLANDFLLFNVSF